MAFGVRKVFGSIQKSTPGARFSKVPKTFRARKAIHETPTCLICKAGLFICCIGNKNQNNCKVSCLETPSFWRYKENYVTRIAPEKSRDFWETGPWGPFLESPDNFRARKASRKTTTCLFCKAGLFICCKGSKNENNCKVSCLETPSFWRYKENCVTRNTPEKFRDFRETGPRPVKFRNFRETGPSSQLFKGWTAPSIVGFDSSCIIDSDLNLSRIALSIR